MNSLLLGVLCGLVLGLVWTSPITPGEIIPLSEEERKQAFEILGIVTPILLMASVAIFQNKWMGLVKRIGAKLPDWMTKEIGQ